MLISGEKKEKVADIAKRHNLALLVLFGSRARGDGQAESDFDIAYSSIKPMSLREENQLALDLYTLFGTSKVDLVNLHQASPLLLRKITEEGILLYEAEESLFNNLYLYAMRVYREMKSLNQLKQDYVFQQVEQFKQDVSYTR